MNEQVIEYRRFLERWQKNDDRVVSNNSVDSFLFDLPRAFSSPIKQSFRPHEIVPGLYLGALHDVQPLQTLHRRIVDESRRRAKNNSSDDGNLANRKDPLKKKPHQRGGGSPWMKRGRGVLYGRDFFRLLGRLILIVCRSPRGTLTSFIC
ncbi:unnamed protein product [Phytomonas sp. Hart1]|nr:unnamed protein product [Phytomonas sp. Hart1]|eukprot:CCW69524.1 unnamed protein product [Phytomonas sp. isolate Hart1]